MPRKKVNKEFIKYGRYAFLIIIVLGVFLISYMFYHLYLQASDRQINSSYLLKKKLVAGNYKIENDLSNLKKINGDYFIYISYTGSKDIYNFEKSIAPLIKKYKLQSKFYYISIDTIVSGNDKINIINDFLGLTDSKIQKVPTIIYVDKDKKISKGNIITRLDDNIIEKGDFQQLLDIIDY